MVGGIVFYKHNILLLLRLVVSSIQKQMEMSQSMNEMDYTDCFLFIMSPISNEIGGAYCFASLVVRLFVCPSVRLVCLFFFLFFFVCFFCFFVCFFVCFLFVCFFCACHILRTLHARVSYFQSYAPLKKSEVILVSKISQKLFKLGS